MSSGQIPPFNCIQMSVNNSAAYISLNRPDHANGMNMEMIAELSAAAQLCNDWALAQKIRVVCITGVGKIFCAGGDINSFRDFGESIGAEISRLAGYLHNAISLFMRMPVPVITAVNGAAAGAGFSLAMCGDVVLAAEGAVFTMAYTAIGLSPDGAATYTLPKIIGWRRAQELMLLNRRLTAPEAQDWGLITRVVPDELFLQETEKLVQKLSSGPTRAFGTVKRLLISGIQNTPEQQMLLEAEGLSALSLSTDGQEGIRSFLEKRKPVFTGQ